MSHAVGSTRSGTPAASSTRAQAERAARQLQQSDANGPPLLVRTTTQPTTDESPGWFSKLRQRLLGDEGASYGISLLVHVVILAIFAVPVIQHVTRDEPLIASIVEQSAGGGSPFGLPEMVNTELAPARPLANVPSQLAVPDLAAADESLAVSKALLGTPEGQGGQGTGAGAGIGAGDIGHGMMQFVPKNAVRKGSFAAWTTPVFSNGYQRKFGEPEPQPGDSPRPMQPYWITIQIQVPGDRTRFPIRDLVGEVIGTDGYRQVIPRHTFLLDKDGKLVPLVGKQTVPIVEGFVQFVVQVPGARNLVKDTIVIKSKLLKEEQALELVFSGAPPRDVQEEL